MIDPNEVMETAEKEFAEEEFRRQVEIEKERLKLKKSFWVRLFPWRIQWVRADYTPTERKQELVALMDRCELDDVRSAYSAWYNKNYQTSGGK